MRRQKSEIVALEGATQVPDPEPSLIESLKNAKIKMRILRKQYRDFSSAMGLGTEFERVGIGI